MSVAVFILFAVALVFSIIFNQTDNLSSVLLGTASDAVTFCIKTGGTICFFCGLMNIAKEAGITDMIAKISKPVITFLVPSCKSSKEASRLVTMNISSNLLGLGNAATPYGIAASKCLFELNKSKVPDRSLAAFIVLNTASVQLLPTTVSAIRQAHGASQPLDILPCVLITQFCACVIGLLTVALVFRKEKRK